MKQKEEVPKTFMQRYKLLHWLSMNKIISSDLLKVLKPMDGKTPQEKEAIAAEILPKLQHAKENGTLETMIANLK